MKIKSDFNALWKSLMVEADLKKNLRFKALLLSHEHQKERLCRKLGVVCVQDVVRVGKTLKV